MYKRLYITKSFQTTIRNKKDRIGHIPSSPGSSERGQPFSGGVRRRRLFRVRRPQRRRVKWAKNLCVKVHRRRGHQWHWQGPLPLFVPHSQTKEEYLSLLLLKWPPPLLCCNKLVVTRVLQNTQTRLIYLFLYKYAFS